MKLTTHVREFRTAKGFTQEDLAEKAGVTRQTILFLEAGKYNPSLALAWRISRIFGKDIEDVFIIEEETNGNRAKKAKN